MAGLQSGEGHMTIDSVVWAQYINVTDTQPRHHNKCRPQHWRRAVRDLSWVKKEPIEVI